VSTERERRLAALAALEAEAMRLSDEPLPEGVVYERPGHARSKILQVRLNPEEYEAVEQEAARRQLPVSTLVRSWILQRMRAEPSITDIASRLERVEQKVGLR
jgi:hypothetical protein